MNYNYRNYHDYSRNSYHRRSLLSRLSMTNYLIIINVIVFIIAYIIISSSPDILNYIALSPKNFVENYYFWTIITSMFMHGGIAHLFVNMMSMFFIGNFIEKIIGRKRFIWFYLISGIFAGLLFVGASFLLPDSLILGTGYNISAVGASGALFGIAGLMMLLTPNLPVYAMFIPIPIKSKYAIPGLLIVIALISTASGWPVGNIAHLGGLIAGIVYGIYLKNKYKRKAMAISMYFK